MKFVLRSFEYLILGFVLRVSLERLGIPMFSLIGLLATIVVFVLFHIADCFVWGGNNGR